MGRKTLETLTESMFYALMALLHQPRCGTEIADFVSAIPIPSPSSPISTSPGRAMAFPLLLSARVRIST